MNIPTVRVEELHTKLGFQGPINYPISSLQKPLTEWKMEIDDAPIFRYIYRNFKPSRHLEFGTWQGTGTLFCLEECDATVWTINIPQGEWLPDGTPVYHAIIAEEHSILQRIERKIRTWTKTRRIEEKFWRSTDSFGFIGKYYLEAGLGHRVCQLYCDSKQWDIRNYPSDFFDTVLI